MKSITINFNLIKPSMLRTFFIASVWDLGHALKNYGLKINERSSRLQLPRLIKKCKTDFDAIF